MNHRTGGRLAAVALVCVGIAGCGGGTGSTSTKPKLSPQQYDNAQSIAAYIPAVRHALAPFSHPQANPTDIGHAERLLRTAIGELKALTPPTGFAKYQADLVRALEGQVATSPALAAALRAKAPTALNNAQAKNTQAGNRVRAAIAEGDAALTKCKANNFTC